MPFGSNPRKRALFLVRHPESSASTRVRLLQYVPHLEANGWSIDAESFYPDQALRRLYETGKRSILEFSRCAMRRAELLINGRCSKYNVVVTQRDVFPWVPFEVERLLCKGYPRFVMDLDDAVYEQYSGPLLRNKYPSVVARMAEVNVGSRRLADYAIRFNDRVNIIPSVVDTERYSVKPDYEARDRLVVGWIGTPVTVRYLSSAAGALRRASTEIPFVLRCVGAPLKFSLPALQVESVPWTLQSEPDVLRTFDVGIMPLINEPFAHGKCGYKLIQYMAAGVPALGTAIGANSDIISDGVDGFLASSDAEFSDKLVALLKSEALRRRIGGAGRQTVEACFSLKSQQGRVLDSLERAAQFSY